MKLLLIYPGWTEGYYSFLNPARVFSQKYSIFPPLNLAYLGAVAEESGYDVKIHDGELNKTTLYDYFNIIFDYKPDIVGLTAYTPSFQFAEQIAKSIKTNFNNIKTLIGGVHYSAINGDFPDYLPVYFDHGFSGKSLSSFKKFLESDQKKMFYNQLDNDIAIKNILPSRHLLENHRYKRPTKFGVKNFATIFLSIGCPYKCIFCSNKNQQIIYRDTLAVIDEVKKVKRDYGIDHFVFLDDTLTINRNKIYKLCEVLLREDIHITFEGSTRANLVDDDLMKIMSLAGMTGIGFGLETADEDMRNAIKKNVETSAYIEANKLANKYEIITQNSCIIGLPNETIKSIKKTLIFLRDNKDIKQANISIATPYPGTELYRMAENNEAGLKLLTHNFSKYKRYGSAVMDVGNLKASDLVGIQKEAFGSIYIVPWRWKYTIQRSGLLGLFIDFLKISKLILMGKWRFLFNKYLKDDKC